MRPLKKTASFVLVLVLVTVWGGITSAGAAPLRVAVYIDKDFADTFASGLSMKIELAEVFGLASERFEKEIGRGIEFSGNKIVELSHKDYGSRFDLNGERVLMWLFLQRVNDGEDMAFFLTSRAIIAHGERNIGLAEAQTRVAAAQYVGNRRVFSMTILHELGHLCGVGAGHTENQDSIMHYSSSTLKTFGEFIEIIKEKCGE